MQFSYSPFPKGGDRVGEDGGFEIPPLIRMRYPPVPVRAGSL